MNRPNWKDSFPKALVYVKDNYVKELEEYCNEVELDNNYLRLINGAYEKALNKSLWALNDLMGDKGIYISLGYKDLYFASFEELSKWIEND